MLSTDTKKLEEAYELFNKKYFDDMLPRAMITIQSSRGAYGHCTSKKIWANGEERYYELNLSAEYLARPIENVLATLMHEMVHIYCMERGIKDTSNAGRYHNKYFKYEAERRGLLISRADGIGWSVTAPTERFIQNIHAWGLGTPCENYRLSWNAVSADGDDTTGGTVNGTDTTAGGQTRKPSSTRKYQCPCCGNSVRATKEVNILCLDCEEQMVKVFGRR